MVTLIAFIAYLIRKKRKFVIPIVQSVTTQVVEYEDIDPNMLMNNNPAYDAICASR